MPRTPLLIAALGLSIAAAPAKAQDSMQLALSLADVLGSEQACGLAYDQDAIASFIERSVAADDMEFTGSLSMFTKVKQRDAEALSGSAKTVHCTQIRRVARSYGFSR